MGGGGGVTSRGGADRAITPIVGFVLLVGIVVLASAIVVVAGTGVVDDLGSEADLEQTLSSARVTDHRVSTAGFSDRSRKIPFDDVPADDARVTDDGTLAITWYDAATQDPDDVDEACNATVEDLGAVEYEVDDRTIAYQSGAIWERKAGTTVVHSSPDIDYDGESLMVGFVKLEDAGIDGDSAVATPDWNRSRTIAGELRSAAQCDPSANDVLIRLTSDYHHGWYRHLTDAFGDEATDVTVTHHPDGRRVEAVIENVSPPEPAFFAVDQDHGVTGDDHQRIVDQSGERIVIDATIENRGGVTDTQNVGVSIVEHDIENPSRHKLTLDGGEAETETLEIPYGQYEDELEAGETYEYVISTEDDETDIPGTFYMGEPGSPFVLANASVGSDDGTVTISVDVSNVGVENDTRPVELDLEYLADDTPDEYDLAPVDVTRGFGKTERVVWELNESRLLEGDHAFAVTTGNDTLSGTFGVDDGVDPTATGLQFERETTVDVSVLGTETGQDGTHDSPNGPDFKEELYGIHANLVVTDLESGDRNVVRPWGNDEYGGFEGNNLNTYENREVVWEYSLDVEANTSLTVGGSAYRCDEWRAMATKYFEGGRESDDYPDGGEGDWRHYDCEDYEADDVWFAANASEDANTPFVRVRDAENDTLPELRGFHPRQRNASQILEDHDLFGGVDEDGTARLDLANDEFVFLFELTEDPEDQTPEEFFQGAFEDDDPGDPNFNDMIVHVEVDRTEPEEIDDPFETVDTGDADPIEVGTGESSSDSPTSDDSDIEVDTTYIVIE